MILLNSVRGKQLLIETLQAGTAKSYIPLSEHYITQYDPSYCGLTTFVMVCNALAVDPKVIRWKGGWRYFTNENVLLSLHPCFNEQTIKQNGITMNQFHHLAKCQGLHCTMKRPISLQYQQQQPTPTPPIKQNYNRLYSIEEFRNDIQESLSEHTHTTSTTNTSTNNNNNNNDSIIVVSFSRSILQQTGDGHFSPIAAYHAITDTVLILDVARFKYQPYWVSIETLYNAMIPYDTCTNQSRGWFIVSDNNNTNNNPVQQTSYNNDNNINNLVDNNSNSTTSITETTKTTTTKSQSSSWKAIVASEDRIPVRFVPLADSGINPCPLFSIKGLYCPNSKR